MKLISKDKLVAAFKLAVLACLCTASTVSATTRHVTTTADSGAGSLRAAVTASASGDTVDFVGLATPATITLTTGQIEITQSLTISGPGADKLTVSGNNASRIFLVNDGNGAVNNTVAISGITFTGGNGVGENNPGLSDGTNQGGAISCYENLTLTACTITGNTAGGSSGGVHFTLTSVVPSSVVDSCTFTANTCGATSNGGAFAVLGQTVQVRNSTLSANTAGNSGAGAFSQSSANVSFLNCTIVSNVANGANGGGGLRVLAGASIGLKNTIVAGNTCASVPSGNDLTNVGTLTGNNNVIGDAGSSGGLTNGTNGNIVGVSGAGIRALNTIINTTLANNGGTTQTHALAAGSVALDTGNNADAVSLTSDQRGFTRVINTTVDIGAFETGAGIPTVTAINPTSGTTAGGTPVTITGTGFTGATGVTIGGTAATGLSVTNDTTLSATSPAHAAGAASVLVTTPGGTNAANTLYTYVVPDYAVTITGGALVVTDVSGN
ncbi:MAG: putative calcium-binding protein, partial [Verrucomicrobiaceae bacterium]|nr:putative calcium-binding protein [Verrucomicrobiaceae bacterium]